jgi:WD40 repeat protein
MLQGQPKQVLSVPEQAASAFGLTDLAFFGGGSGSNGSCHGSAGAGYVLVASGGQHIHLWDTRAKAGPCASLIAPNCGTINTIQLAPGGQVVMAGTQKGEVRLWDLRSALLIDSRVCLLCRPVVGWDGGLRSELCCTVCC